MSDPLKPSPALLAKLGSIAVHAEELIEPGGHEYDRQAIIGLLSDPEFQEWRKQMKAMCMLPVKRSKP